MKIVNYNRDTEVFHLLKRIIEKITGGKSMYQSPTDMGVNRTVSGIVDDLIITEASHQEIIRRYYRCAAEYAVGLVDKDTIDLAGLPDNLCLLPKNLIDSVTHLKKDILNGKMVSLYVKETLIVLVLSAISNTAAKMALENLKGLRGCEVYTTHIPTPAMRQDGEN